MGYNDPWYNLLKPILIIEHHTLNTICKKAKNMPFTETRLDRGLKVQRLRHTNCEKFSCKNF